jgi:hypothetical protein
MRRLTMAALALAFIGTLAVARAEDKPAAKADKAGVTGTWKWTITFGEQKRDVTLNLKQDGEKVTGGITVGEGKETPIEDGKYKNGELSFKVTRERKGQKFTSMYKGKVMDDTIKGKMEFEFNGETRSRDWEAKRAAKTNKG